MSTPTAGRRPGSGALHILDAKIAAARKHLTKLEAEQYREIVRELHVLREGRTLVESGLGDTLKQLISEAKKNLADLEQERAIALNRELRQAAGLLEQKNRDLSN